MADTVSPRTSTRRNSRAKTIIILLKVWLDGPKEIAALRQAGLGLLAGLPAEDRVAVYWGMVQAAYPFWRVVATQVGRLLRLQEMASAKQIQQRMREALGDRQIVYNATQRVLRSCVDWGILADAGPRGVYGPGRQVEVLDSSLAAWLIEALLTGGVGRASASQLLRHPSLYPFRFPALDARELVVQTPRLDLLRHGLDDDLVMLRKDVPDAEG